MPPAPNTIAQAPASKSEVVAMIAHLSGVMDELLAIIEQETALVRAGKLSDAAQLSQRKTDLAASYMSDAMRLKASPGMSAHLTRHEIDDLRQRHDLFHALLQINLTVLATAHAVSEGIVRGVNGEMQRRAAPSTYTAAGQKSAAGTRHATPLTLSRTL